MHAYKSKNVLYRMNFGQKFFGSKDAQIVKLMIYETCFQNEVDEMLYFNKFYIMFYAKFMKLY